MDFSLLEGHMSLVIVEIVQVIAENVRFVLLYVLSISQIGYK